MLATACGQTAVLTPSPAPTQTNTAVPQPTPSATQLPPTPFPSATLLPPPSLTPSPPHLPTPSATPDLYAPLTIDALTARSYGGGQLEIIDTLERNDQFTRYLITYPSDGLTIYGYMNVPNEGSQFPVALMLHGYIPPAEYQTVAYTRRYADALAEAGYFVIHPNFRNYPPSDEGPNPYRIGYAIDVLNLIAIIREQSQDETGYLRRADADNIHLWGHSMGGGVALRVLAVNNAPYLKAAVLYAAMSGDEQKNNERIQAWTSGRRGQFELAASPEQMAAISPINYLDRINAAISVHHSRDDAVVPVEWSEELCAELAAIDHPYECFFYDGLPHTFNGGGDALFMERVVQFFRKY
ncbi:MAG TPA: alpha/beta fold hydrolase [Anaerolineae bacterium]|nr:alpha/beta fold hydrolase [Anaerolineae bacterium]